MRATFGDDPTAGSKNLPFKFNNRSGPYWEPFPYTDYFLDVSSGIGPYTPAYHFWSGANFREIACIHCVHVRDRRVRSPVTGYRLSSSATSKHCRQHIKGIYLSAVWLGARRSARKQTSWQHKVVLSLASKPGVNASQSGHDSRSPLSRRSITQVSTQSSAATKRIHRLYISAVKTTPRSIAVAWPQVRFHRLIDSDNRWNTSAKTKRCTVWRPRGNARKCASHAEAYFSDTEPVCTYQ